LVELVVCASAFLLVDQWSKRLALRSAGTVRLQGPLARLASVISAKRIEKRWGGAQMLIGIWCAALVSAVVLVHLGAWFQSHAAQLGLAAAFGGAAGNLVDMVRGGSVVDFIDLRVWPSFNLADVAIVGGLALAFWQS
jgi:lipoprotein signal peptidase